MSLALVSKVSCSAVVSQASFEYVVFVFVFKEEESRQVLSKCGQKAEAVVLRPQHQQRRGR